MKRLRRVLLGLIALTLAPTLYAANPCVTGGAPTLRDGDGSGSGGTGLTPQRDAGGDGSGTGGTGQTVEVEGVITGFASICVNGLELHYLPTTPVSIHGTTGSPRALRVGQIVRALARQQGDRLAVQRVHVRHLLIAPLQGLHPGRLLAQDRTISLSPDAVLPAGIRPGIKVAVSGFAGAPGHWVATRLDVVPDDTPDGLAGEVQRNARGELTVDGVTLGGRLSGLEPGDIVRAEGRYAQGRMWVDRFEREERAMPVDRIVIQGVVRQASQSELSIGGQRFLIDARTRIKQALPRPGEMARIDAIRDGRRFHVREVDVQPRLGSGLDKPFQTENGAARHAGDEAKTDKPEPEHLPDSAAEHSNRQLERSERPEARESPEMPGHTDRPERPEKVEKPEKAERPEKVERLERVEKLEKIERPEKIEKPERAERPERREHDD